MATPKLPSSTSGPLGRAPHTVIASPQQDTVALHTDEDCDLTEEDMIALIKYYRGNDIGLAGQNRRRLLVLLKHYEVRNICLC